MQNAINYYNNCENTILKNIDENKLKKFLSKNFEHQNMSNHSAADEISSLIIKLVLCQSNDCGYVDFIKIMQNYYRKYEHKYSLRLFNHFNRQYSVKNPNSVLNTSCIENSGVITPQGYITAMALSIRNDILCEEFSEDNIYYANDKNRDLHYNTNNNNKCGKINSQPTDTDTDNTRSKSKFVATKKSIPQNELLQDKRIIHFAQCKCGRLFVDESKYPSENCPVCNAIAKKTATQTDSISASNNKSPIRLHRCLLCNRRICECPYLSKKNKIATIRVYIHPCII